MKKAYVKPQVAIENYYLSEMISGCGAPVTFSTSAGCANNLPTDVQDNFDYWNEIGIFNTVGVGGCDATPGDMNLSDDRLGFCYFTSTSSAVFGS